MKHLIVSLIIASIFFSACGNENKNTTPAEQSTEPVHKDTIKVKESIQEKPAKPKYPKITEENVVDFLTQYGKDNPEDKVKISTQHGDIILKLYEDTPLHRANFIYLVKQKYFDGTFFHRVVPNFIIQGGNSDNVSTPEKRNALGPAYLLPAEIIPGRKHTYGTVSGAKEYRENPDKRTAPYEFFIFVGPDKFTSHLNGNYTVFARVIEGMDIAKKISELPADDGEWPKQNVYIKAEVID